MKVNFLVLAGLATITVLTGIAVAQDAMDHGQHAAVVATQPADAATDALNAAMAKMHKDMIIKPTGDADADFIRGMIPHHQGAIDMAEIELQYGKDPEARKLAADIIAAQKDEIAMMKKWLEARKISDK